MLAEKLKAGESNKAKENFISYGVMCLSDKCHALSIWVASHSRELYVSCETYQNV